MYEIWYRLCEIIVLLYVINASIGFLWMMLLDDYMDNLWVSQFVLFSLGSFFSIVIYVLGTIIWHMGRYILFGIY